MNIISGLSAKQKEAGAGVFFRGLATFTADIFALKYPIENQWDMRSTAPRTFIFPQSGSAARLHCTRGA
jgi:hypothetical protein